jgi:hypothetical protein
LKFSIDKREHACYYYVTVQALEKDSGQKINLGHIYDICCLEARHGRLFKRLHKKKEYIPGPVSSIIGSHCSDRTDFRPAGQQNRFRGICSSRLTGSHGIEACIERILSLLDIIIDALSSSRVLTVIRTSVSVVCLLTVIGIIGGIESGAVNWGTGIIVSLIAAVIEAVCIRKCR